VISEQVTEIPLHLATFKRSHLLHHFIGDMRNAHRFYRNRERWFKVFGMSFGRRFIANLTKPIFGHIIAGGFGI
ncbi:MAG: hypothetical protein WC537_01925, partial [Candidatus Paceibacterota bacterium]